MELIPYWNLPLILISKAQRKDEHLLHPQENKTSLNLGKITNPTCKETNICNIYVTLAQTSYVNIYQHPYAKIYSVSAWSIISWSQCICMPINWQICLAMNEDWCENMVKDACEVPESKD